MAKKKAPDVRKPADVKDLLATIKSHPLTIVLIHADYCGHCQTYKKDIWEPLQEKAAAAPAAAKNGLASIHYDQLENTPFASAKIKGYPSVIVVGKKDMAEFKDEEKPEEVTNAMPMSKARDSAAMEKLLETEPSELPTAIPEVSKNVDVGEAVSEATSEAATSDAAEDEPSPPLDTEAESAREKASASIRRSLLSKTNGANSSSKPIQSIVPDEARDVLNSQLKESVVTNYNSAKSKKEKTKVKASEADMVGGSLYSSLLAATRAAAPAVALTAAAVAMSKPRRSTRKLKRKARKGRKSRNNRNSRK